MFFFFVILCCKKCPKLYTSRLLSVKTGLLCHPFYQLKAIDTSFLNKPNSWFIFFIYDFIYAGPLSCHYRRKFVGLPNRGTFPLYFIFIWPGKNIKTNSKTHCAQIIWTCEVNWSMQNPNLILVCLEHFVTLFQYDFPGCESQWNSSCSYPGVWPSQKPLPHSTWVWSAPFLSIHFHMDFSNNEIIGISYFPKVK